MSEIDREYQQIVDRLAEELLLLSPRELLALPDYGSVTRQVGRTEKSVGFWHYAFDDEKHHIVFKVQRRCFLFLYASYVSGVMFGLDSSPRLMTPKERDDYD
jgi:hypothetical protein